MPSRKARKFANPEGFHLFMKGLRSLQEYDRESTKTQPNSDVLKKRLRDAQTALDACVKVNPDDILPRYYLGMVFTVHAQVEQALYFNELLKQDSFTANDLLHLPEEAADYLWKAAAQFAETEKRAGRGDIQRYARYNQAQALGRLDPDTPNPACGKEEENNWDRAKRILSGLEIPGFKKELLGSKKFRENYSMFRYRLNRFFFRKAAPENEALALQTSMVLNFIELRKAARGKQLALAELPQNKSPELAPESSDAPSVCLKCLLEQIKNARLPENIKVDMIADYWNKWAFVVWERALQEEEPDRPEWLKAVNLYLKFLEPDRSSWTPWQLNQVRLLEAQYQMVEMLPTAEALQMEVQSVMPGRKSTFSPENIEKSKKMSQALISGKPSAESSPGEQGTQRSAKPPQEFQRVQETKNEVPVPPQTQPAETKQTTSLTANEKEHMKEQYKKGAEDMLARILGNESSPPVPTTQPPASAVDADKIAAVVEAWASEKDAIATASNMRRSFPGLSAETLGRISVALAGKVPASLIDQICRQYAGSQP